MSRHHSYSLLSLRSEWTLSRKDTVILEPQYVVLQRLGGFHLVTGPFITALQSLKSRTWNYGRQLFILFSETRVPGLMVSAGVLMICHVGIILLSAKLFIGDRSESPTSQIFFIPTPGTYTNY